MTEIPEDIMRRADQIAIAHHGKNSQYRPHLRADIARTIMDERERCAVIADHWATEKQRQLGNGGPKAAILKGEA